MLNKQLIKYAKEKSVIREAHYYGCQRERIVGSENVFDFSLGNPSVEVPETVNQAIIDVLNQECSVDVHGYGPGAGHIEVRESVAQSLNRRFHTNYSATNIFMAMSAAGALQHAFRSVIEYGSGDEVIAFAPYFPEYIPYVEGAGGKLVLIPSDPDTFLIHFEELESRINEHTKVILLNSPNNPTGVVYLEDTILQLVHILEEKQRQYGHPIYIISDEPYREIVFKGVKVPYIAKYYKNTMSCYSFSKSLSIPGERIGYIAVNSEADDFDLLIDCFIAASRLIGHNGPATLIQKALIKVIDETSDLSVYETNKDILYNGLTSMGYHCVEPGGTFYMFPRSLESDANTFCEKAKALDLILVPGDSFGCPGHFRIAYCVPTEKVINSLPLFEKLAQQYEQLNECRPIGFYTEFV